MILGAGELAAQEKAKKDESRKSNATPPAKGKSTPRSPVEAQFKCDYAPPGFNPRWERPQINRTMLQDFVIFAHQDLDMVKKLVASRPNAVRSKSHYWRTVPPRVHHVLRGRIMERPAVIGSLRDPSQRRKNAGQLADSLEEDYAISFFALTQQFIP